MKVLLVGASSYLGARLYFDLAQKFDLVGTYASHRLSSKFIPLDVTKQEDINKVMKRVRPDVIIHAANNASAKWCDTHPAEAVALNQTSMEYITHAAETVNAKVIYISSFSADDPSSMYGKTKHESEKIVKQTKSDYLIIRPSLILGYSPNTKNDRPFNRILKNLDEKTPALYDTSWKFQPTYIRHISEVIQQAMTKNIYGETIPVAVSDIKSRFDVARDILTPFDVNVIPVDSQDRGVLLTDNLKTLHKLGMPQYSYDSMIKSILDEIRQRDEFVLQ